MNIQKWGIWFLVIILAVVGSFYYYNASKVDRIVAKLEKLSWHNLQDIEKLTNQLVGVAGAKEALSLVNSASINSGGIKHLISHEIGALMYRSHGPDSIVDCEDDGLNGCLHGFIIEAIVDIGYGGVYEMIGKCKNYSDHAYKMCVHGAGHAFLAISNYEIDSAISMCDELVLSLSDPGYEVKKWCGNGLFMENVHGDHNGLIPIRHPSLSTENLLQPCDSMREDYKATCFNNQAGWWHQLNGGDINLTIAGCDQVPKLYQSECADNVARLLNTFFPDKVPLIYKYCMKLGSSLGNDCLVSAAVSSLFVGNMSETSLLLCDSTEIPGDCYNVLIDEVKNQEMKTSEVKNWCENLARRIGDYECNIP